MLALGIPGSGTAAILLGGLMVWGLNPGPLLFVEHKDFVWGLIASMYLGNVVGLVLVLTTVPIFASILRVPFAAVAPMIVVSCAIGAYAIQNAMFDIWLMLGFGVVGYVFKKIGIPLAPFTLALVLGNRAEDAFRLSMIGSGGDMKVFWSNGLVGSITTLAIVLLFWPVIDKAFGGVGRLWRPRRMPDSAVCPGLSELIGAQSGFRHTTLRLPQLRDLVRAEAELGQHLVGLLAEFRRPRRHLARRARQREGLADQADVAVLVVRHVLRDAEMLDLGVLEHLVDRIDRAAGHAGGVEFA